MVACLVLALNLALIAQAPQPQSVSDDSFSTTIVLQKKIYDDSANADHAHKPLDDGFSADAFLGRLALIFAAVTLSCCTTRRLTATYLATFINPPSRAPPFILHT